MDVNSEAVTYKMMVESLEKRLKELQLKNEKMKLLIDFIIQENINLKRKESENGNL